MLEVILYGTQELNFETQYLEHKGLCICSN